MLLRFHRCVSKSLGSLTKATLNTPLHVTPLLSTPFRLTLLFCVLAAVSSTGHAEDRPPNVLFILADDLGWSDTSLYGQTDFYRTPNIQRLASRGMTFTRAYAASPLCSPTRASILTGLSPARHGITAPECHTPTIRLQAKPRKKAAKNQSCILTESVTRLDPKLTTIAESLKNAGYATGHFGKWHLGADPYSPLQHGFDVDIPHWHGPGPAGSYVAPWKFKDFDHDPDIPDEHIEDRMAKEAVQFMQKNVDKPFFLNYWMFSVHAPFDAKASLINKYKETVDSKDQQRCPTYAAMIESMDDAVGTLLDELDRLHLADNTIIIFASDNGGNMYNLVDGERPTSNRPLRGGKATMYEGGVRTPAVVVWPDHTSPGSQSDVIIQSMDYYPTILEMLRFPPDVNQTFDGVSLCPVLQGQNLQRDGIFTFFPHQPPVPDWIPPSVSVHAGDWKLIRIFHGSKDGSHRYKLFDLKNDIGEQNDLSDLQFDRVKKMDAMIESHLVATSAVVPVRNPTFDPSSFDLEREGRPAPKFIAASDRQKESTTDGGAMGWQAGGTCEISLTDQGLQVKSQGRDPHFRRRFNPSIAAGDLTLKIRLRSKSNGGGQVFWSAAKQPFRAERSKVFEVVHDGMEHEIVVPFSPQKPIRSLRLDPSRDSGLIVIRELELLNAAGRSLFRQEF